MALSNIIESEVISMVREVTYDDLDGPLQLYLHLHEKCIPKHDEHLENTWDQILNDDKYHIIVCVEDDKIVSSCTCLIVPNLTRTVRPYALIENVVTHSEYRNRGYANACLSYAQKIALSKNCYKIMLTTGSKDPATLRFYENAGFSSKDKTSFSKWFNME